MEESFEQTIELIFSLLTMAATKVNSDADVWKTFCYLGLYISSDYDISKKLQVVQSQTNYRKEHKL